MTLDERIERAARAIAPLAWAALGLAGTLAQANRRKASLRHARRGIEAAFPELFTDPPTGGLWVKRKPAIEDCEAPMKPTEAKE